jgi:hypothetical protein
MPKLGTKFSIKYKHDFPFLSQDPANKFNAICATCRATFSIKNGGRTRINEHVSSKKHIESLKAVQNAVPLNDFFKTKTTAKQFTTAASELGFTYHVAKHGISFNSTSCSSELFQELFDKQYRCASTKTAALVKSVIAPIITQKVRNDLEKMNFVTLMTDASNKQDIKLLPVLVRGFDLVKGVVIFKLDIKRIENERATTICGELMQTSETWKIKDKIVGFGSDNTNTNFGGPERNGSNNVFALLKSRLNRDVFGLGCLFHVVGNSVQAATALLPHDIPAIIEKMFSFLHIHAVRVASLQAICEDAEVTYKKLTRQSNVRCLTMLPAINRITGMFLALKNYFLNHDDCPTLVRQFFETDYSLFWLLFLEGHLELTNSYVLRMEAKEPASFEVSSLLQELLQKIVERKKAEFMSFKSQSEFNKLSSSRQARAKSFIASFYKTQTKYIERWMHSSDGTEVFKWCSLKGKLDWNVIKNSLEFIFQKLGSGVFEKINRDKIFDEVQATSAIIEKISEAWDTDISSAQRWIQVFKYMDDNGVCFDNMKLLVELIFYLPGTNAQNERLFSIIFDAWSNDRGSLGEDTLDALTSIKFNSDLNCQEFYRSIKDDKDVLQKVLSSSKYH